MLNNTPLYMDIATDFSVNLFTGDLNAVYDTDAIKQSVYNLVKTTFYSRPNEPQVGCSLYSSLFEFLDPITVLMLENSIKEVIENYEPRVQFNYISVQDNIPQKAIFITVYFTDKVTNSLQNVTINLKRFR